MDPRIRIRTQNFMGPQTATLIMKDIMFRTITLLCRVRRTSCLSIPPTRSTIPTAPSVHPASTFPYSSRQRQVGPIGKTSVADPGCLSRIPDPDFYPARIPDLGSRIQKQQQKRGVKKNLLSYLLSSHKYH
jgi:hypothetical protein